MLHNDDCAETEVKLRVAEAKVVELEAIISGMQQEEDLLDEVANGLAKQILTMRPDRDDAQEQVRVLRKVIEWPERLGMYCQYCGRPSSVRYCDTCLGRMLGMPILSAFLFNQNEALAATAPSSPAEEAKQ